MINIFQKIGEKMENFFREVVSIFKKEKKKTSGNANLNTKTIEINSINKCKTRLNTAMRRLIKRIENIQTDVEKGERRISKCRNKHEQHKAYKEKV